MSESESILKTKLECSITRKRENDNIHGRINVVNDKLSETKEHLSVNNKIQELMQKDIRKIDQKVDNI